MTGKTIFMGKRAIEELSPIDEAVVVSISDSDQDEANLRPGWKSIHRVHFVDGGYDEASLRFVGTNYKYIYASYFDRELSIELCDFIRKHVQAGVQTFIVNCHAGRSRSAAIAKYILDTYGFEPFSYSIAPGDGSKVIPPDFSNMNVMVYTLLKNPFHFDEVIRSIESTNSARTNKPDPIHRLKAWLTEWLR